MSNGPKRRRNAWWWVPFPSDRCRHWEWIAWWTVACVSQAWALMVLVLLLKRSGRCGQRLQDLSCPASRRWLVAKAVIGSPPPRSRFRFRTLEGLVSCLTLISHFSTPPPPHLCTHPKNSCDPFFVSTRVGHLPYNVGPNAEHERQASQQYNTQTHILIGGSCSYITTMSSSSPHDVGRIEVGVVVSAFSCFFQIGDKLQVQAPGSNQRPFRGCCRT